MSKYTKENKLSKMLKIIAVIGCIPVYYAFYGGFTLSLPGGLLAMAISIPILLAQIRDFKSGNSTYLSGHKSGRMASPVPPAIFHFIAYYIICGYGVIPLIHESIGVKKTSEAQIHTRTIKGSGRFFCGRKLAIKLEDSESWSYYCVDTDEYMKATSIKHEDYLHRRKFALITQKVSLLGKTYKDISSK